MIDNDIPIKSLESSDKSESNHDNSTSRLISTISSAMKINTAPFLGVSEALSSAMKINTAPFLGMSEALSAMKINTAPFLGVSEALSAMKINIAPFLEMSEALSSMKINTSQFAKISEALSSTKINTSQFVKISEALSSTKINTAPIVEMSQFILENNELKSYILDSNLHGIGKIISKNSDIFDKEAWENEGVSENIEDIRISEDESVELNADVEEILSSNHNWQQKLAEYIEKWKKKNPIVARLLFRILLIIVTCIITISLNYMFKVHVPQAALYEAPSIHSITNYYITYNEIVFIADSRPYYFKVQQIDDETGDVLKEGWVSKRSIKPYRTDDN